MPRLVLIMLFVLFISGCDSKDDALYAPWGTNRYHSDTKSREQNLEQIVNNQISIAPEDNELCVTQTSYPHNQACSKQLDN